MSQSIDDFLNEQKTKLSLFEVWWKKMHAVDPDKYPLVMQDGNEGLWWEMFHLFDPMNPDGE